MRARFHARRTLSTAQLRVGLQPWRDTLCGMRRSVSAALLLLFAALPGAAPLAAQSRGWLGSWTTANFEMPADAAAKLKQRSHLGAETVTLRQVVRLAQGGKMLRVRLSNELGTVPLTITSAHVAFLSTGSKVLPGTDRPLLFGGQTSVTIAPGGFAASDTVAERVPIFSDLVISTAIPAQPIAALTYHELALQTTFFAAGDQTASPELDRSTPLEQAHSWFFLKDVEVDAGKKSAALVCLGDSITDGARSTPETDRRYPDVVEELAAQVTKTMYVSVLNAGIGGNRLLQDGTGPRASDRLERDVLSQPGAKFVLLLEGINDIGASHGAVTAEQLIAAQTALAQRAHTKGLKVYGGTLTPFEGAGYYTPAGEEVRQKVNAFLRSNTVFDGLVDFDLALRDPAQTSRLLPKYDSGDHLHPSDAGYAAMGSAVPLRLLQK